MLRPILWATIVVATVFASGEFVVLHSPDSVTFTGNKTISQNLLTDVFLAVLGFTPKPEATWSVIQTGSPFDLPKAVVIVAVEGVKHLNSPAAKVFPLDVDEIEETTWQGLTGRLQERDNDNIRVRMCLEDGLDALGQSALGALTPTPIDENSLISLSPKNPVDHKILKEIKLLDAIAKNKLSKEKLAISANRTSDVYWLVVSGVRELIDNHGENSAPVKEALVLLNDAITNVTKAFMSAYDSKVVIVAFTNDAKVRHARSVDPATRVDEAKVGDSDTNFKEAENTSLSPVIDSVKNDDEEEIEKNEDEEANTRTSDVGSSLKKMDESPSITESYEARSENTGTEANEARESSTVNSSLELDDTTLNNEQSNTDTENTNRSLKIDELKLAKRYNDNYPVIFNIFLWFGVVFFFSLLAICITIADMDPGRDSIIYRMTSTRMKKDN